MVTWRASAEIVLLPPVMVRVSVDELLCWSLFWRVSPVGIKVSVSEHVSTTRPRLRSRVKFFRVGGTRSGMNWLAFRALPLTIGTPLSPVIESIRVYV